MSYKLEWITDRWRWREVASEWDRVAEREPLPFLLSAWLEPWYDAFAPGRMLIATLWRERTLIGGAPLVSRGRRLSTTANDHTPASTLLAADADAAAAIARALVEASGALVVRSLPEGAQASPALLAAAAGADRWTLRELMHNSLIVDTAGTLESYRGRLSPRVRSELGRLRRKAQREHEVSIRALERPTDLPAQLARAFAVEASGWKGRAGTAITSLPNTERFYTAIAERMDATGKFGLSELLIDGELAAVGLSIVHQGRVYTVKFAYDERFRSLGPGFVLLTAMLERCFELGIEAYEFCGPDHSYERRFATGARAHLRLRVYRRTPAGAAGYVYHRDLRPLLKGAYARGRALGLPNLRAVCARYAAIGAGVLDTSSDQAGRRDHRADAELARRAAGDELYA